MIKLPINSKWTQLNISNKFGSLAYTKNINLDEQGYIKLSPRTVNIFDDTENVSNVADDDFGFPVAFGRHGEGDFALATTDEPFNISITDITKSILEDSASNNPNLTFQSHGLWWQNYWYETTTDNLRRRTTLDGSWSADLITDLEDTSVRHYMAVIKSLNYLAISDRDASTDEAVVKLYDRSHALIRTLRIPPDFEIIGLAYNNYSIGIITRLGDDTEGQNAEAFFFVWDGASENANSGVTTGAYACISVVPYKSSFVIITNQGQILYWNGGGFEELSHFPFYGNERRLGDTLNLSSYGNNIIVDGDVIYINLGLKLTSVGKRQEEYMPEAPSGVWCYDPEAGLYHRYSPSLSRAYLKTVLDSSIDTATDLFTTSATIPATGNPVIMTQGTGDLSIGRVYYVIKVSSTTFRIADTKEKALAGVYIDITTATTSYFWMYDIKDFGIGLYEISGGIAVWGTSRMIYRDVLFGNRVDDAITGGSVVVLNTAVPTLENRGYFTTVKIFLDNVKENIPVMMIKHRPLDIDDAIIVKMKSRDYLGLPVSSPNNASSDHMTWASDDECYTSSDLSGALTAINSGAQLELELLDGAGAGQMVKIESITYEDGIYSLELAESVVGAVAGYRSNFIIDAWKECMSVTYSTQDRDHVFTVPSSDDMSAAPQFKIELRGYETCIEDILIPNRAQEQIL